MSKLKVLGKSGLFLIVKKGRLASDAEACATWTEVLQHVGPGDTLELDAAAVVMVKEAHVFIPMKGVGHE